MDGLGKDQILRVNCPGFGHETHFTDGYGKPLPDYKVAIINATSLVHLFDKNPAILSQIDHAIKEGMTSFTARSDKLLESVTGDLDRRINELAKFLEQGGLLVYFLNKPLTIMGPTLIMDNYRWLDVLTPDNPAGRSVRKAVVTGLARDSRLTDLGMQSPFKKYLEQSELPYCNFVYEDNLTAGYKPLAIADGMRVVSASIEVGSKGGSAIFLPAPYNPASDELLLECIQKFFKKDTDIAIEAALAKVDQAIFGGDTPIPWSTTPSDAAADLLDDLVSKASGKIVEPSEKVETANVEAAQDHHHAEKSGTKKAGAHKVKPDQEVIQELQEPAISSEPIADVVLDHSADNDSKNVADDIVPPLESVAESSVEDVKSTYKVPQEVSELLSQDSGVRKQPSSDNKKSMIDILKEKQSTKSEHPETAEAVKSEPAQVKDVLNKFEKVNRPDWCDAYVFDDVENLKLELMEMKEQLRMMEIKVAKKEQKIYDIETVEGALVWSIQDELIEAVIKVFNSFGWHASKLSTNSNEILLVDGDKAEAIVRVIRSHEQPQRTELSELCESVVNYWAEHEHEPKAILLAAAWSDLSPHERKEADFPEFFEDFSQKKKICLLTSMQLLSLYREFLGKNLDFAQIKEQLLHKSGLLSGFELKANNDLVANDA